jgi:hypothetical protein
MLNLAVHTIAVLAPWLAERVGRPPGVAATAR